MEEHYYFTFFDCQKISSDYYELFKKYYYEPGDCVVFKKIINKNINDNNQFKIINNYSFECNDVVNIWLYNNKGNHWDDDYDNNKSFFCGNLIIYKN